MQLARAAGIDVSAAAEGRAVWSPAVDEPAGDGWSGEATVLRNGRLTGAKTLVAYPAGLDALVVTHREGTALVAAPPVVERSSLDPARPMADVRLDGEVLAGGPAADGRERATVLVAADLCGTGRGAIELASAHARDRHQFGRPIGSFQGVAFQLADAFVGLKAAWDLTLYAAWAVDEAVPGAMGHVHAAKAKAGEAALFAAERTIQVFGGMGITWEADPHLYLRRVLVANAWFGTAAWHRRQVGRLRMRDS
jgi:alkylation response protein AidB-like acyl-CoA dehydrogenase